MSWPTAVLCSRPAPGSRRSAEADCSTDDQRGVVPNPLLEQLIRDGAQVVPLTTPCEEAEPRYWLSVKLQRFVRCRDLTADSLAVTPRPRPAISTTPSPIRSGPPTRPTCAAYAANIICCELSGPVLADGLITSRPMAPSSGPLQPATRTPLIRCRMHFPEWK